MTENERLNNAIIAAIEERDRLRAERDNAIAQCVLNGVNAEALRAEIDTLRQQKADDAESLTAAANTIRDLRADLATARAQLITVSGACDIHETDADQLRQDLAEVRALLRQVDKKSCAQLSEWYEFIDEIKDALAGKDAT